ncbi:MAG TPA: hypothetical protein DCY13_08720 [Verrucomicrobiales bacterium]|nr:hypothetical protein [Verrucomicrobiales bacterium]
MTAEVLTAHLEDPETLERLYRHDPGAFGALIDEAIRSKPESPVLRVWSARLHYQEPHQPVDWPRKVLLAAAIILAAGTVLRLPIIWLSDEWFLPRFAPLLVTLALATYFWFDRPHRRQLLVGLGATIAVGTYVWNLPGTTDSTIMALLHVPILCWVFIGWVFTGDALRDVGRQIDFLRFNGELLMLASLVALGGMVFSAVTIALFSLLAADAGEIYVRNVGAFGIVAVPVAGTLLYDVVFRQRPRIASILARIFAPLFLVMVVGFLLIAFLGGQNPFTDRSLLISLNGLLLVVLGISVYAVVERREGSPVGVEDYVNLALIGATLLIDVIALAAIISRLASFGWSPNRVVVLGANLTIMMHLAWMLWTYVGIIRGRKSFGEMRRAVAGYLPAYGLWALVAAVVVPVIFRFN